MTSDPVIPEPIEPETDQPAFAELAKAKSIADALNGKILRHLHTKSKAQHTMDLPAEFEAILNRHAKLLLQELSEPIADQPLNFYDLVKASKLARANKVSRLISTYLGTAWEEMAALSLFALRPEIEFGQRITGIDLVILDGDKLRHTQVKTQRNTLTGSQVKRARSELALHEAPLFAAAFAVGSWTFSSPTVERLDGTAFWTKLAIDYGDVVRAAANCCVFLEKELFG
jgi:hypothetical protein